MKIAILKDLMYYDNNMLWKSFFEELGLDVIVPKDTNRDILNNSIKHSLDEDCLAIKVFYGHVESMKDKVDYIFIPKIINMYERKYNCPKTLELSSMIKHSIKNLPKIIDVEVDMLSSNISLIDSVIKIGNYFTDNKIKILKAYYVALKKHNVNKAQLGENNIKEDNSLNNILSEYKRKGSRCTYGLNRCGVIEILEEGHILPKLSERCENALV